MKFQVKQTLFKFFSAEWEFKFNNIPFILKYLSTYPELVEKLKKFQPLMPEEVDRSQMEWVSLITQFDHPLEQEFFKPYWVPINQSEYDYFIDLSSDTLALFEIQYFPFEPYRWHKKYLFKDIVEFLISVDDSNIDIESQMIANNAERQADVKRFFIERDLMGFEGKIEQMEINKNFAIVEKENASYIMTEDTLVFHGIYPTLIGLFPGNTEISVQIFNSDYNRIEDFKPRIRNITALVYLLQSVGKYGFRSYRFTFSSEKESFAEYRNNVLTVRHSDQSFLRDMIEKYEFFKNSQ